MKWKTIRLELAANADFPKGSVGRCFLIRAPMGDDGTIDEQAVNTCPEKARVCRTWANEPDERGLLVRVQGQWAIRFPGKIDRLIDPDAAMLPGQKVTVHSQGRRDPYMVRIFD